MNADRIGSPSSKMTQIPIIVAVFLNELGVRLRFRRDPLVHNHVGGFLLSPILPDFQLV